MRVGCCSFHGAAAARVVEERELTLGRYPTYRYVVQPRVYDAHIHDGGDECHASVACFRAFHLISAGLDSLACAAAIAALVMKRS